MNTPKFKLAAIAALFALPLISGCSQSTASNEKAKSLAVVAGDYQSRPIQDEVFYFVLPDRFYNGDKTNDMGDPNIPISFGGLDKTHSGAFHGGDVRGLMQKLPYLEEMGITSIWLTPILRNQAVQGDISGYHGYWVLDFTEIDPHVGSNADLKNFIDAAHDRNIKVFFDIITNHTADVIKYAECHGADGSGWSEQGELCPYISLAEKAQGKSYTTVLAKGTENLKTPAWLNDPKYYHNQGDSTFKGENSVYGDFFGLDDVDTDSPEVVEGMIDIFKNIVTEFKPDGFRVDTVKHVNIEFWQQFVPAIEAHAKTEGIDDFFMFGEVYSADTEVLSRYTNEGNMRSVLDFAFQEAVYQTLVLGEGTDRLAKLFADDVKYKTEKSDATELLNFVSNHDMGRFALGLRKQEHMGEDERIERNILAQAMMYFLRGVPVVYYGDEQGFIGDGGNHDSRQDMMPSFVASYNDDNLMATDKTTADDNFDQQHPFYLALSEYARVYKQHQVLRRGQQSTLYSQAKPGLFAVKRFENVQDDYVVVVNTDSKASAANIGVNGAFELVYSTKAGASASIDASTAIELPSLSLAIYKAK